MTTRDFASSRSARRGNDILLAAGDLGSSRARLVAVALAAIVVVGAVVSGTVESTDITLVIMGFDPDRAQLITSLVIGGVAAAAAVLAVPDLRFGALLGWLGVTALYLQTFVTETQNAIGASGALGSFSPGGWLLTLLTLVVIAAMSAAAGAALAMAVRPALVATVDDLRRLAVGRQKAGALRRPVIAALILVLLVATVPAFGDMVNLSPDVLMLGGVERISLTGGGAGASGGVAGATSGASGTAGSSASAGASVGASPSDGSSPGSGVSPTPDATGTPRATNAPGARPWLAWRPTGSGKTVNVNLPAPWNGGTRPVADITIYTTPGYSPTGSRTYPVLYEAPTGFTLWNRGTGATSALDSLIDSGAMPPSIVVFIDEWGAPFPDSECADSTNGQMWMETFISKTVPQYVDSHFKTIARPAARALMGMSAGGFCAAMVVLRHPDVFGTSISFSGYYHAGAASANSARPFGTQAALLAHSPADLISTLSQAQRRELYIVVIADPGQAFYGPEAANFDQLLTAEGYDHKAVASPYTHGWPQVRYEFPGAMSDWAARLVVNRVF